MEITILAGWVAPWRANFFRWIVGCEVSQTNFGTEWFFGLAGFYIAVVRLNEPDIPGSKSLGVKIDITL